MSVAAIAPYPVLGRIISATLVVAIPAWLVWRRAESAVPADEVMDFLLPFPLDYDLREPAKDIALRA